MCNIQKAQKFLKHPLEPDQVGKRAFFVMASHCLKRNREEKVRVFYVLSADADQIVTSVEVEQLCVCLLESYAVALKKTAVASQWKLETDRTVNQHFAKMAVKELLGSKEDPSYVSPDEMTTWFTKLPLIEHLFVATIRACFFDVEGLVEGAHHGLSEGCEETVEHVQYDR